MIGDFCGVTKYLLAICFRENKPLLASPMAQVIKYLLSMQETQETWVGKIRKIPWRRKWQPTPGSLPGKPHGQRRWRATVHRVSKSGT